MLRLIVLSAAVSVVVVLAVAGVAGARDHAATATTVKVTAKEWKFALSRKSGPAGKYVFKVVNKGKTKHDFKIGGKSTPLLKPGGKATLKVTLKKGKKKYICTVSGHAALGMKGTFKAT
ncbi:MAG: cupredoxin domain-containing protein [Actinomycetota bacterium]|nr:cupredoxin domain-containing protein [Actinomycetota bacterium]